MDSRLSNTFMKIGISHKRKRKKKKNKRDIACENQSSRGGDVEVLKSKICFLVTERDEPNFHAS